MSENKLDPILAVRGLAAVFVVWFHNLPPSDWLIIRNINLSFLTGFSGTFAVYIFYMLSGYVIGYGYFAGRYKIKDFRSLGSFYLKRFVRLAPSYYVCLILAIFVFYHSVSIKVIDVIRFFTFTANFHYTTLPYLQLLAIISTEMQFYIISPLLYLFLKRLSVHFSTVFIGLIIIFIGIGIRAGLTSLGLASSLAAFMENIYVTVWGMLDYFLFGMFISFVVIKYPKLSEVLNHQALKISYYLIALIFLLWINYITIFPLPWHTYALYHLFIIPPLLSLILGYFIVMTRKKFLKFTFLPSQQISLFLNPKTFLYGIGSISYSIYLYHFIFIDLWYRTPGNIGAGMLAFLIRFVTTFTTAIFFAALSAILVESPFSLIRRKN